MTSALERLRSLCVADVMTRDVVQIAPQESMLEVARKFVEYDVTAAPVTDANRRCVGFFSAADFLRGELHLRQKASLQEERPSDEALGAREVSRYMSSNLRSFSPQESLLSAARFMCEHHLHRLPVVDDDGGVVGIISTMDVVAALVNAIDEMEAAYYSPPEK